MRIAAANTHGAWGRPDEGADRLAFGETHPRPDVFELRVDRRRLSVADLSEDPPALG